MVIGVIGALENEIEYLVNKLCNKKKINTHNLFVVYRGTIANNDIVIACSGMGKVNSSACTQMLISNYEVERIVNVGIAGSLNDEIVVDNIVISSDALCYDFDLSEVGCLVGYVPGLGTLTYKSDEKMLQTATEIGTKLFSKAKIRVGRFLSGDKFVASDDMRKKLHQMFNGACVDMESGSIAQISYINNVPYLVIRGISDGADSNATDTYHYKKDKMIYECSILVENLLKYDFDKR